MSDSFSILGVEKIISRDPIYLKHPPIFVKKSNTVKVPLFEWKGVVDWALIDVSDADIVLQYRYHRIPFVLIGKENKYYARSDKGGLMHHIVKGKPEGDLVIDHINGITLDNRGANLKPVTRSQNAQNRPKKEGCTSKYVGVSVSASGDFKVQTHINGKTAYIGIYKDETVAALVHDYHVAKYYGVDAASNGLLTREQKEFVIANDIPEEYKKKEQPKRELPENICAISSGGYRFSKRTNGERVFKTFSTLEKAIKFKEKFLQELELECQTKEVERLQNETLNSNGDYVIRATNGDVTVDVLVDKNMWRELSKYTWNINNGYCRGYVNGITVSMHRYVYERVKGPIPANRSIDHINTVKLDNRIDNLRPAGPSLQGHNKIKNLDLSPSSKHRGVFFNSTSFYTMVEGFKKRFDIEEDAALKANELFTEKYGENARLNVVDTTKRTTAKDRLDQEVVTKESILNVKTVEHLKRIIKSKGLNNGHGHKSKNKITYKDVTAANLEKFKQKVIELLFLE